MEKLLEEVSFDATNRQGQQIRIDTEYVNERLNELAGSEDLARYVL